MHPGTARISPMMDKGPQAATWGSAALGELHDEDSRSRLGSGSEASTTVTVYGMPPAFG